ncbi:uncharacterized protein LOC131891126 [Tigriopus californicus]|uniref:uncharacterized protein LOC131891126 n=1 Tax=Tigriopus californicus TaxID=6832 RepID=UPI0027DAABCC|nr:uncharacterized protein LOC131891126 [Tigriopus californicus]
MTKLEKSKLDKSKLDISMSGNSGCDPGAIMKGMTEPLKEQFNRLSEETSETSPESTTSSRKFDFDREEKNGEGLRFRGPAVDPVKIQGVSATGESKPACSDQEDDDGIRHSTTNIHPDHIKPSPVESRLLFKPFEGMPTKMKMTPNVKKRMDVCAKKTASLKKKPISDLSCGHLESSEYWDTHVYGSPREPRDGSSSETEDDPPAMNPNGSTPKSVDPRKFSKQSAKRAWSKITANFHAQSFFCQFRLIEAGQVMYYIGYALLGPMVFVATLLSLFLVFTGTSYFTTGHVVVMVPSEYEDVQAFKRCVVPQEHRLQWVFTFMAIFMFRQFSDFLEAFCKSRVVSFGNSYLSTFILIVEEVVHLCGLWMLVFDVLPDVDLRYGTLSPFCLGMIPSVIGLMTNRFGTKWIFVKQIIVSIISVIGQFGLGWIVLRSQDDLLRKMFWCCMAISVKFWDHFVVQPRNSQPNERNSLMAMLFKLADHKRKWLHSIKLLAFPVKFFCLYILLSQYFGYIGFMPIINLIQQVYPFTSDTLQCRTLGPPILSGPTVSLESVPASSYIPYILGMFLFTLPEFLKTWGKWVSHMGQHFNLFVMPTFLALLTMHGFAWCVGLENGSVVVAYFVKIFGHGTFSPFLPRNSFSMDNSDLICLGLIILSSFLCCYSQWLKFLDYYVLQNQFMVKIKPNITPFIFGQNYDFRVTARTDAESMPPAVASRPFIYACATIWREDMHEMSNLVKSLFQIDRACAQLQTACKFEFIIVIDDAFHHASAYKLLGKQVFKLLNVIRRMMRSDAQIPEVTYPTPFGARMEMTLPDGGTKLVILLKDTSLVKQGKRFSQALYLNYLVDFQFQDLETMPLPIRNEIVRNKFILTLDGDVNFTPASVFKLLDRMTTHPMLSAVCGRIIPTGPCTLWTHAQIYEYAIGHWIQKPVEDCLGSVLCAPGCFSMFRLYDMMETKYHWAYSVSRPHTISMKLRMDQGEDRWMSFLLIAAGGRIGYEPDAICFTECPDTLAKLFGQRRRWITSSFMGVYHFASILFTQTTQDQLHVGNPAQWYQMFITASTLLSPAVCLMFLVFGFNYTTGISLVASAFLFVMPIAVYAYICHVCEDKVAVLYGCILSGLFTAPLALVVISLLQVG